MIGEGSYREEVGESEARWGVGKNIDSGLIISDELSVAGSLSSSSSTTWKSKAGSDRQENVGVKHVQGVRSRVWYMRVCTVMSCDYNHFNNWICSKCDFQERRGICLQQQPAFREAAFQIRLHRFKKGTKTVIIPLDPCSLWSSCSTILFSWLYYILASSFEG